MRRFGPFRRSERSTLVDEPTVVEDEEVAPPPPPPPRGPLLWPWLLLLLLLVAGGLVAWWLLSRDDDGGKRAATVVVPNVVRLEQHEAVGRVNDRGLVARVVTKPSSAEAGTVFAQDPTPGANVTRRSVVTLSVSAVETVVVPDVVGKRIAAAVKALEAKGLQVETASASSAQAPGTVLSQRPDAGTRVSRGSTAVIQVSRGLVRVPNVIGQPRDGAVAAIRAAGLVPQAFTVSSTQRRGTVVAQSPRPGARVRGGSKVRLNVSNGRSNVVPPPPPTGSSKPASVTVPDVVGQPQAVAQRRLNSSGLKAGVVYVPSEESEGTVVSQSPEPGTMQRRGTRIQLNASLGPNPRVRIVPDVVGLRLAAARSRLESAGFEVQVLSQGVRDRSQLGDVVDEQPSGGRRAPAGSTVTIYVGRAA
jgi:beta-lactam-binding protein with PASTA domain